ncbi:hypothetical protein EX30DRAFT_5916 [Ascodesmis nigricans]|uniref:Uncharacterized protein n=1 Tax=Ascodesmis nigricans TaxID=341454 RepID=A0A4S2N643_9PEZI|nr:hypothetical protein EX30DRAFT_5916 [Ascodesmis nigricans]
MRNGTTTTAASPLFSLDQTLGIPPGFPPNNPFPQRLLHPLLEHFLEFRPRSLKRPHGFLSLSSFHLSFPPSPAFCACVSCVPFQSRRLRHQQSKPFFERRVLHGPIWHIPRSHLPNHFPPSPFFSRPQQTLENASRHHRHVVLSLSDFHDFAPRPRFSFTIPPSPLAVHASVRRPLALRFLLTQLRSSFLPSRRSLPTASPTTILPPRPPLTLCRLPARTTSPIPNTLIP